MPTYEYLCESCGHQFEEFQSIKANPIRKCPKCGKKPKRLISAGGGILFKGSGFYQTDYRSEGYKKKEASEKEKPKESSEKPKQKNTSSDQKSSKPSKPSKGDSKD